MFVVFVFVKYSKRCRSYPSVVPSTYTHISYGIPVTER